MVEVHARMDPVPLVLEREWIGTRRRRGGGRVAEQRSLKWQTKRCGCMLRSRIGFKGQLEVEVAVQEASDCGANRGSCFWSDVSDECVMFAASAAAERSDWTGDSMDVCMLPCALSACTCRPST